ncbi:hypothetical protein DFH08DRAFT_698714 [Mycena albidolilacea]|uniref:Uncharacterized protein n=1 Tax=Mycena albidolilacea TaxID=1033008 RepID=A0AAD7A2R0_9AGAR|nr:hypothetical protein DFH08DRAFT_698714 [Mycena albidolilacea]
MELQMAHTSEQVFILNMHALHNAHLIHEILPRALTTPIPYFQESSTHLRHFVTSLRNEKVCEFDGKPRKFVISMDI